MSQPHIINVESLRTAMSGNWQPKFVFFWGHTAKGDHVDKHVLSQWWAAPFEIDGQTYSSAEQYMMAEKARLFADENARQQILATSNPGKMKAIGRGISGFDEAKWTGSRFDIVVKGNCAKFGQNKALSDYLLQTGSKVLVEASPVDRIWGIGLAADDPRAQDPTQWLGLNLLGFALMEARRLLAVN